MCFHVSLEKHEIDTVLIPGHWGATIRQFRWPTFATDKVMFRIVLVEMALETARQAVAASAPSRLNCVFVAESLGFARSFRDQFKVGAEIYRVEPVGDPLSPFRADFMLITRPRNGTPSYVAYMPEEAIEYWSKPVPTDGLPELLYPGELRVVEMME